MRRSLSAFLILLLATTAFAASGTKALTDKTSANVVVSSWLMSDQETSTATGVWVDFRGYLMATLQTSGISAGGTFQIYASNAVTKPTDATDGIQVGSDITTNTITSFVGPYHWVKVKITVNSGDTLSSVMTASTAGGSTSGTIGTVTVNNTNTADYDTGAGTATQTMMGLALPSTGGPVAGGTATNPVQVAVPQSGNNLCTGRTILSTAGQNEIICNASNAVLYSIRVLSATTTMYCLNAYNKGTMPDAGVDVPKQTFYIPPASAVGQVGGFFWRPGGDGIEYDTGLGLAIVGQVAGECKDTGAAVVGTGMQVDVEFRDK